MICAECSQSFENEIDAVIQNHEPCATKHGTQPTALQQLKAKISEVLSEARKSVYMGETTYVLDVCDFEALQKLSTV